MSEFVVNAKCIAKDGTSPEYTKTFKIEGRKEIMKRFGLTEGQFEQEAADNIARRIANGVRQMVRESGAATNTADVDDYVNSWMPGRKTTASPINAVKKMLREQKNLTPESSEVIESILAKAKADIEAQIAATLTEGGE